MISFSVLMDDEVDENACAVKSEACLSVQRAGHVLGEIGQNAVAPGALEGHQAFQHHLVAVNPAVLRRLIIAYSPDT